MSLKTRFLVLLGLVLAIFVGSFIAMRRVELHAIDRILKSTAEDRQENLDRIVDLVGEKLRTFSTDYSMWDDMLAFTRSRDAQWAAINIDAPLVTFDATAAWVFATDGSLIYQAAREPELAADLAALLPPERVRAITARLTMPHFFAEIPSGVLEIRGAPILPSDDLQREQPASGWWFVAKRWDASMFRTLARLTDSEVKLARPGEPPPFPPHPFSVQFRHELRDHRSRPIAVLHFDHHVERISEVLSADRGELLLFIGYGLLSIAIVVLALLRWVIRPLEEVGESLASGDLSPVSRLRVRTDEIGAVAQLVETAAAQRVSLESLLTERARLGRNLHDSVIQTIYACGMGISSARVLLRQDPPTAERLLDETSEQFNAVIQELRSYIMGLEPEDLQRRTFREAVQAMADFFRATQPFEAEIDINEAVVRTLTHAQRVNILHVIRECLSNALRHGKARHVHVALSAQADGFLLTVSDDGCGFDPLDRSAPGRKGLANLGDRAHDLGGTLRIDSSPLQGTRIQVSITPSSPIV